LLALFGEKEEIHLGSSLKFCHLAEGLIDIYLRVGSTMEWDTAAGHYIAECAGARMHTLKGKPFLYNKKSLKNKGFICFSPRREILEKLATPPAF
jgi:3'(2'), 5'-bisphosphate nucleotidase